MADERQGVQLRPVVMLALLGQVARQQCFTEPMRVCQLNARCAERT